MRTDGVYFYCSSSVQGGNKITSGKGYRLRKINSDIYCAKCGKFLVNIFEHKDPKDKGLKKLTPQKFVPKKETVAKKLPGVRKKEKDKHISLDQDIIHLKGDKLAKRSPN